MRSYNWMGLAFERIVRLRRPWAAPSGSRHRPVPGSRRTCDCTDAHLRRTSKTIRIRRLRSSAPETSLGANPSKALRRPPNSSKKYPAQSSPPATWPTRVELPPSFETVTAPLGADSRTAPARRLEIMNTVARHASAYFQYWGDQAGPVGKGYYSYDLGGWHIIALNTNCDAPDFGGCGEGSPEELWLRDDLRHHPNACIVAYGHHALFSSGIFRRHAMRPELKPLWQDLYYAHADLMLVGHEHSYERFAPQDPDGVADPEHGIREIVVGTGGRSHDPLGFAIRQQRSARLGHVRRAQGHPFAAQLHLGVHSRRRQDLPRFGRRRLPQPSSPRSPATTRRIGTVAPHPNATPRRP